jgi:membrane protein involved in colicin uptake
MARASPKDTASGCGCLSVIGLILISFHSMCSSTKSAPTAEPAGMQERAEETATLQRRTELEAKERAENARRKAAERAQEVADVAAWTPAKRLQAIASCHDEQKVCVPAVDVVFAAAPNDIERAALRNADLRYEAAKKRKEAQREAAESAREAASQNAPLLCCDGTASPSCTCGGSHRGCCSHHGGVCGCTQ